MPTEDPGKILEWCYQTYGARAAIGTSLQGSGLAIIHIAQSKGLRFPIFTIDTGLLFEETLNFKRTIEQFFDIEIEVLKPSLSLHDQASSYGEKLWRKNPNLCCELRKVAPLHDKLVTLDAWITGVRREQTPERQKSEFIEIITLDGPKENSRVVKVNPLLEWTAEEVQSYLIKHSIPVNPLVEQGYASIGCYPCTKPIANGAKTRDGRWSGSEKTECGIHLIGKTDFLSGSKKQNTR